MENIILQKQWVQGAAVVPDDLRGTAFTGENGAHTFRVTGIDANQDPVAITGTITGKFLAANNVTVPLTGSIDNGAAVLTMTEDCYAVPGRFIVSIFATNDNTTLCIYCGVGNVFRTESSIVAYPSASIPDIQELIDEAQAVSAQVPGIVSAAQTAVDGIEDQKNTMIASIASVAGQGTDTTLTQSGVAADAKAAGDQISDLKSAFDVYGAANHAPVVSGTSRPGSFTVVADGTGNYTINGSSTGSGLTHYDIYNNTSAFPSGFGAGDELFLVHDCANSNIIFCLFERVGGSYSEIANIPGYGTKTVKLSANATGCIVRLSITNGTSYTNVVSTPLIMTTLTKQETEERLTANEYDIKHITPVDVDNQYYYANGYRFAGKTFVSNTGIIDSTIRALCEIDLNDGAVVYFDNSVYTGTYMIIDTATKKTLLVPSKGWNTTGKMVIDTNGVNNYTVLIQFKDKTSDSNTVDPTDADKRCFVLNKNKIVDLILFAGQSNMAGRGSTNSTWTETAPTIIPCAGLEFRAISDATRLYPIAEPFGVNENKTGYIDDGNNKTGSMVTAFVNNYYTLTGTQVVGVSASEGGSTITDWEHGSLHLQDAMERLTAAKTFLASAGYSVRHIYMAWCQGESDTREGITAEQYKTKFRGILDDFKTLGVEKCFMCRIGEYNGDTYDYSDIINAQTEIGQDDQDVVMVTTTLASFKERGLMKDEYHFYQAGYNEMGRYAGTNAAMYVNTLKEPTMYDPKNENLYYSHKN